MRYPTVLEIIGHTPLVQLKRICSNPAATILLKLEFFNPGFSIKDRMVKHIIDHAEKSGELKPGGTLIENTSGNTGAAVAMIAAIRGYRAILTMPDKVSQEKQNALKAYGAEILVCPTAAGHHDPENYVNRAKRLSQEIPNSFRINQYDNPLNPEAHYLTTGPEIWQQTEHQIDYFVASSSTGGSISGVGRFLKEQNPEIKVVMPDPIGSVYYEYFKTSKVRQDAPPCTYLVEGIGEDHLTEAIDFTVIDDVLQVTDKESFHMARKLASKEGILAGGSTGANVHVAVQIGEKLRKPATIVTLACDTGIKYLTKIYNDQWMKENHLL